MEKEIIERWEKGKGNLRTWFKSHEKREYNDYKSLVITLINNCLNYNIESENLISNKIDVSNHGKCRGTQIFLIHKECYQPELSDYYIFHNHYGSCSACDTLLSILEYDDGFPDDWQVDELMKLCLHLIQRMKRLDNILNENC